MIGCVRSLRVTIKFVVELDDFKDGLLLAQSRRLLLLSIKVNAMAVFHVISSSKPNISTNICSLLEDYRKLLNILGNPSIKHIDRETNGVDD